MPMASKARDQDAVPSGEGRARILAAAREVFSMAGFEGASLRRIADHAGVQHQLLVYHFKTKDALWREVISSFFVNLGEQRRRWLAIRDAEGAAAALRALVREFVLFTARQPEYHRIATFEGRADSERLRWLLETHVRPFYEISTALIAEAQANGAMRTGHPGQIHYATIGLVTTSFVFGQEYRLMTGRDAFARDEVSRLIELTWDFLGLTNTRASIT